MTLRQDTAVKPVNADSIATFASLLVRARLLNPDPQSPAGDGAFRKLLTAFFRPTIVYDRVATERARQELRRSVPNVGTRCSSARRSSARTRWWAARSARRCALQDELAKRGDSRRNASRIVGAVPSTRSSSRSSD